MQLYNPLNEIIDSIMTLGGFVNAHCHFDRSYTINEETMRFCDDHLFEKWKHVDKFKSQASILDYKRNIEMAIANQEFFGTQAACSFIDIDPIVNYTALSAATIIKNEIKNFPLVVACQTLKGVINRNARTLIEDSIDGIDIIGSLPAADPGKESEHLDIVMTWAKQTGKRLHVHVDQLNTDEEKETELLARKAMEHGLYNRVSAIHSISLACHPKHYRDEVYRMCKDAGLSFICCPSAWIDHRRQERKSVTHNSITPVDELLDHDIKVALGTDNICDVYKPYTNGDMVNELRLLIDACRIFNKQALIDIAINNGLELLGLSE